MSLRKLFQILSARWLTALVVMLLSVGLAIAVNVMSPKRYTANASVVVDVKLNDPIAGMSQGGVAVSTYMTTQMDVIASEKVISRAIKTLKLHDDPQFVERWHRSTGGEGEFSGWMSEVMRERLDVRPSRDSNVLNLGFSWSEPKFAATMVNAIVRAYTDTALEFRIDPARQYNIFFDERSKKLREDYEHAQARLSAYEREKGLITSDDRIDVENARLAQLSAQVVDLQVSVAETASKSARVRSAEARTPEVLNSLTITAIKSELSKQRAEIQQLRASYGEEYPRVKQLADSIEELRQRLSEETRHIRGGIDGTNDVNQQRLSLVRTLLNEQREKVMKLKTQRDEAAILQRDVQNAQRAYDAILARLQQSSLESQNTQSNVSILMEAKPPLVPSSPKVALNIALALVAGAIFGIAAALGREAMDPRIRTESDILNLVELPLIVDLAAASRGRLSRRRTAGAGWFFQLRHLRRQALP